MFIRTMGNICVRYALWIRELTNSNQSPINSRRPSVEAPRSERSAFFETGCASARPTRSRGKSVASRAQSLNVVRKPCVVMLSRFIRRSSIDMALLERGAPLAEKTRRSGPHSSGRRSSSNATAPPDNGTACSTPELILIAGMLQSLDSKSISPQVAPKPSPLRAAVRITNSRHRAAKA